MTLEKKPFVKYKLDTESEQSPRPKSLWLNNNMRRLLFEVGSLLRQSKLSTIIRQSLEITLASLTDNEKIVETLYGNGRCNKRSGIDSKVEVQQELAKLLSIPNRK